MGEDIYGVGFIGLLPNIHKRGNRARESSSRALDEPNVVGLGQAVKASVQDELIDENLFDDLPVEYYGDIE